MPFEAEEKCFQCGGLKTDSPDVAYEDRCNCAKQTTVRNQGETISLHSKPGQSFQMTAMVTSGPPEGDSRSAPHSTPKPVDAGTPPLYRIKEKIGEGGMGSVFLAENKDLLGQVAVKVMKTELVNDRVALKRFEKEVQAISQLTHPNIVQVLGYSAESNSQSKPYMVMEYIDGANLAEILRHDTHIQLERVVDWTLQICEAVQHAHNKGVIHRDLKPSNILITENVDGSDTIKIVDFGIAKLAPVKGKVTELTQEGEIFGSPSYMSPEQCLGKNVDARTDIYSLGCIIYEALAGRCLFEAESPIQVLVQQISSPIKQQISVLRKNQIPGSVVAVLEKMLEKNPDKRFQSVSEVGAEFKRIKSGQKSNTWSRSLAKQAATAAVVVGFVGIAFTTLSTQLPRFSVTGRDTTPQPIGQQFSRVGRWTVAPPLINTVEGWLSRIETADKETNEFRRQNRTPAEREESSYRWQENSRIRQESIAELKKMGVPAIPALLQAIRPQRNIYASNNVASTAAGEALAGIGAPVVEPLLAEMKNHPDFERLGISTLERIGSPAGDRLAEMTRVKGPDRAFAANILSQILEQGGMSRHRLHHQLHFETKLMSRASESVLAGALKDETDPDIRKKLLAALSYFPDADSDTFNLLRNILLSDKDEDCREEAAKTMAFELTQASPDGAKQIVQALCRALEIEKVADVRKACLDALSAATAFANSDIAFVRKFEHDPSQEVRQAALKTLSKWAIIDQACMPDLIEALQEPDRSTSTEALMTARNIGPRAKAAVPVLEKMANQSDTGNQRLAVDALTTIQPEGSPEFLALLMKQLQLPQDVQHWNDIMSAIRSVQKLGLPAAEPAMPLLRELAKSKEGPIRVTAEQALRTFERRRQ